MSNLPDSSRQTADGDRAVRTFFDEYYQKRLEFPASEVDAILGFFSKRGFDDAAASSIASTLMRQAKFDSINMFKLLDTLKGLTDLQLSALIAQILNNNRAKSSSLGFRIESATNLLEARNIAP